MGPSHRGGLVGVALACGVAGACGGRNLEREVTDPGEARDLTFLDRLAAPEMPRIVVAERFGNGSRLVLVAEDGRRVRDLTEAADGVMDITPAWSPDGRWIAFASSRGRAHPGMTSIWLVPALGGDAVRLTADEKAIDLAPAWDPSGKTIAFERAADGAVELDLWAIDLGGVATGGRAGRERRLTSAPGSERMAAYAPDGTSLAYVTQDSGGARIVVAGRDGSGARPITSGPADAWPAWAPDGQSLVFSAPAVGAGREDTDVFTVSAEGAKRRVLFDSPTGDEAMPRWTADGRFVIASSVAHAVLEGKEGRARKPFWWTIVVAAPGGEPHVLDEEPPVLRSGAAVAPVPLDGERLLATPTFRARVEKVARALFE